MKLRIKGNSLRLRLTRGEVERFAADGRIEESMQLASGSLDYALVATGAPTMTARLHGTQLEVALPADAAMRWASSADVSLRGTDGLVSILVEKDFACLVPREGEDDADAFPHPRQDRQ